MKNFLRSFDRRVTKGRLFLIWRGVWRERYRTILKMKENPILIGGCRRSGTTLLLSLLSAHPNIYAVPHETTAFSPGAYSETVDLNAEFCIDFLYEHFLKDETELDDYDRWCEKTPMNVRFADRVLRYFGGGVKFLHIVRDGRDVVTSKHPNEPDNYFVPPKRWIKDVMHGKRIEKDRRVLTIKYEDMVNEHMKVMREVCSFVGETFEKEKFRKYPASSQFKESSAWFGRAREIDSSSIGRWKKSKHKSVVKELVSYEKAKELLSYYGYVE